MPTTVAIRKGRLLYLLEDLDVPEQELLKLNIEVIAQGEEEIYSPVSVYHDYYIYLKPHLQQQGLLPKEICHSEERSDEESHCSAQERDPSLRSG